ncbi:hypothetical protein B5D77_00220 [Microcystis sp. MC19]|nr:hypothetical protein B5D77_00220 [Microcystis sp. MC19]
MSEVRRLFLFILPTPYTLHPLSSQKSGDYFYLFSPHPTPHTPHPTPPNPYPQNFLTAPCPKNLYSSS